MFQTVFVGFGGSCEVELGQKEESSNSKWQGGWERKGGWRGSKASERPKYIVVQASVEEVGMRGKRWQ
jgi:hypothetical protein